MVSLYGILNLGARAIGAAQAGLTTTGQNISNVNTDGYSRQRIDQRAVDPAMLPQGAFGQGVEIVSVERLRDLFLEAQIRGVKSDAAFNQEMSDIFTQTQTTLNDSLDPINATDNKTSGGGISNLLSNFFSAIHDLSLNPESPEVRTTAIESANTLSETFNYTANQLVSQKKDLNDRVNLYVSKINQTLSEVAALNKQISTAEVGGNTANDLRDRRDKLLSDLSEYVPITTQSGQGGVVNVAIAGQRVVDGVFAKPLTTEVTKSVDGIDIVGIRNGERGLYILDDSIRKGKLGAALDARDRILPTLQNDIDVLARGIINEVNKIHSGASGTEGYSTVKSNFLIPTGAENPTSTSTLDTIFNNPRLPSDAPIGARLFPITDGSFSIRVADSDNKTRNTYNVNVGSGDTLHDLVARIDRSDGIVQSARSALTFNPVYVTQAKAGKGATAKETNTTLANLSAAAGTPIKEAPGSTTFSFQIHLQDAAGHAIDTNPTTTTVDPITVSFNNTITLSELVNRIQTAGKGLITANLVPSDSDPSEKVLQITPTTDGVKMSIQNDTSGLIKSFEFLLTDPNTPLIGGASTRVSGSFSGLPTASVLGTGIPQLSPAFPGPPPSVISAGGFDFVVIDNNNNPKVNKITVASGSHDTLNTLASAIQAVDPNIKATVTADNKLVISASNNRSFFFQNDTTGLVKALGFDQVKGYGQIGTTPFQSGSFEVAVANSSGTVTHIFEVPVLADPSTVGGVFSLGDIVKSINTKAGGVGAPIQASIVPDEKDPSRNQILIEAVQGYEFTFRSDDSSVLSALGFTAGPVLNNTLDNPISDASSTLAVGDNIGGEVHARITDGNIEISTTGKDQVTFVGDISHFLASAGFNTLFQGTDAKSMRVNQAIADNVKLLAVSADGTQGNNQAGLAIADLENQAVIDGQTPGEMYRTTIATLGVEGNRANQSLETNQAIRQQLESLQQQNSGVSIDEESINIIRYQRAYQASAKVISTIDQLLDLVINRLGI